MVAEAGGRQEWGTTLRLHIVPRAVAGARVGPAFGELGLCAEATSAKGTVQKEQANIHLLHGRRCGFSNCWVYFLKK